MDNTMPPALLGDKPQEYWDTLDEVVAAIRAKDETAENIYLSLAMGYLDYDGDRGIQEDWIMRRRLRTLCQQLATWEDVCGAHLASQDIKGKNPNNLSIAKICLIMVFAIALVVGLPAYFHMT